MRPLALIVAAAPLPVACSPAPSDPPVAVRNEGKLLFARRYGDAGMQFADTIDVLPGGDLVLSGTDGPAFVAELSTDGSHLWSRRLGEVRMARRGCVAVDEAGNVLVTGALHGTLDLGADPLVSAGGADIVVVKLAR